MNLSEKAAAIKAVVLDIDGVLTDGRVGYAAVEGEIKFFNVRDGLGIRMCLDAGLLVGVISGRGSEANRRRGKELGLSFMFEKIKNKADAFDRMLADFDLEAEHCLYVGDDLIDIPALRKAGVAVAVQDAPEELDEFCDFRANKPGGHGAVREVLEWLLKEKGLWNDIIQKYKR